MPTSLFQYEMLPTTWFYLSSLMIVAIFFKFNRFWSIRNLDIIGLIFSSLGLLFLAMEDSRWGFIWLFACGLLFCIRMLTDLLMVRRPLFEPNLNHSGITFSCILLVTFMWANIAINRGATVDSVRTLRLEQILTMRDWEHTEASFKERSPGFRPFIELTDYTNQIVAPTYSFFETYIKERKQLNDKHLNHPISAENTPEILLRRVLGRILGPSTPQVIDTQNVAQGVTAESLPETFVIPASYQVDSVAQVISPVYENQHDGSNTNTNIRPNNTPLIAVTDTAATVDMTTALGDSQAKKLVFHSTLVDSKRSFWLDQSLIALVMLGHIAILLGLVYIGHCHFNNMLTGISAGMLYLLIPYTNQMTARLDHVIPGALIIWAVALYRRPLFAGICIGSASALVFHPFFLIPLWCSYYWKRGIFRFLLGAVGIILVFYLLLFISPREYGTYWLQARFMLGLYNMVNWSPDGMWENFSAFYRIPVITVFLIFCFGMLIWPSRKHLATLMCCSTIILLGTQFWQAHQGGLYMAWYLPLLIITLFRPNLEDRVAAATVIDY